MWPLLLPCLVAAGLSGGGADDEPRAADASAAWQELDASLAALAAAGDVDPFTWGVLVRAFYTHSPKEGGTGANDVSGQVLEDVDAWFASDLGELDLRVSADLDEGDLRLEDAYGRWRGFGWLGLTAGQLKPRVVRSGSLPDDGLLFRERTFLGAAFDAWDTGFELGGHYDQFDYWFALLNGSNGQDSDHFWSTRGEWALYDAALEDREGAYGSPNHLRVLLGGSWFADVSQSAADASGWSGDLALTFGPYAFHAEWADLDEEFARTIDVFNGYQITLGDGKPRSATLSRRVLEEGEAAVRFESADDLDSTEAVGLCANWRPDGGSLRFVADVSRVEGDTRDFSIFSVGVQVGSSGLARPFADLR